MADTPIFHDTVERVYSLLPQHYQDSDILQNFQFKKYLAGLLKNQDDVNKIIDRLQFIPLDAGGVEGDTSDLVNPYTADAKWLPWLGQLFGTTVAGEITDDIREEVIRASGFRSGSMDSMIAAARTVLVGSKKVRILKHSDLSWQPDMQEHVYATNLAVKPSFATVSGLGTGGNATVTADDSWFLYGPTSVKVVTTGSASSAVYAAATTSSGVSWINFQEGKTYTVSGYLRMTAANNTSGESTAARSISVGRTSTSGSTSYTFAQSAQAANAAGTTRLSVTFTVPADTDTIFVRLMNGSATPGDTVWWDGFMVTEGTDLLDYFDGDTDPTGGYSFRWLGDAQASPSQKYIPAVPNTATQWDMLVMTLQSETLKNLLDPTLSKTLSPSVWDVDFQSYGYDPNYVWKLLADQPGVYQDRAFAFSLKDPTWAAGLASTTGFGAGQFGKGTFGYGTDVTSTLRIKSRSSFDVTPTDSYQFMVSLGLKQDVIDEKRSAIGFQFYDADGNGIDNIEATNMLPDPSFEYSECGFVPRGNGAVIERDTTRQHTGATSLKVTSGATEAGYEARAAFTAAKDTTYTFSAWQYVPSGVDRGHTLAMGQGVATEVVYNDDATTFDQWQYVTVTNTAASDGIMYVHLYGGDTAGQTTWYDDLGLTVGDTPVDFNGDTPDPVDGSVIYQWDGDPGNSSSSKVTHIVSEKIDVTPTIENTNIFSHNFVKSSRAVYYAPYGSNAAAVNISNYGEYSGGDVIRGTINAVATTSDFGIELTQGLGLGPIAGGTTFTLTLDTYLAEAANITSMRVFFRDDTNSDDDAVNFNSTTPASITLTKGRWHTRHWTATVKSDRVVTSAFVVVESSLNQSQGAYLDTANWLIEEGTVSNGYFNGDTPADDTYTYSWDGVPNASVTNKVLTSVAQENVVTMEQFTTRVTAPAGAATAKVFIDMDGFNGKDTLYIAQPGVREEYDETWCAVSADPVQAIIDHNTKPAGMILHWKPLVSDWDTITANGTREWADIENMPWLNLEELGQ